MGKISVRHFLNKNLKAHYPYGDGIPYYYVYMLITYKRKQYKLRSRDIEHVYSEKEFEDINKSGTKLYLKALNEIEKIKLLIEKIDSIDSNADLRDVFAKYDRYLEKVYDIGYSLYDGLASTVDVTNGRYELAARFIFLFRDFDRQKNVGLFSWYFSDTQSQFASFLVKKGIHKDEIKQLLEFINDYMSVLLEIDLRIAEFKE